MNDWWGVNLISSSGKKGEQCEDGRLTVMHARTHACRGGLVGMVGRGTEVEMR